MILNKIQLSYKNKHKKEVSHPIRLLFHPTQGPFISMKDYITFVQERRRDILSNPRTPDKEKEIVSYVTDGLTDVLNKCQDKIEFAALEDEIREDVENLSDLLDEGDEESPNIQ